MMQLGEHFRQDDRSRHSQWLRQQKWFVKVRHEQARKEDNADKLEEEILAFAIDAVLATEVQIEKFKAKLDVYDEATVIALMENQQQLDAVNDQLLAMLDKAYVMEDGRRVFKTEDGTQVFDEFGTEVSNEELEPALIRADQPGWEKFSRGVDQRSKLEAERKQILEFQEKVDRARERADDDKITKSELDDLDAELSGAMPPSVKSHLPGYDATTNAPNAKTAFTESAEIADHAVGLSKSAPQLPTYNPMG